MTENPAFEADHEPFSRPGPCSHHALSDWAIEERERLIANSWGDVPHLVCPVCHETLYPHDDGESVTVHVGEPHGAGAD